MSFYTDKDFFEGKRPWSRIKDKVLGSYLSAYLPKVNLLKTKIILVDAFAGPGKFDDGTTGSPLIICQLAEKFVNDNFFAILVNNNKEHHKKLESLLSKQIDNKKAIAIYGEASNLLSELKTVLKNETLLIYLDPFGLKGCEFQNLVPFLQRPKQFSTEIIVNISVPVIHRLANKKAEIEGKDFDSQVIAYREILTSALGGEYWKEYLLDPRLSPNEQIEKVMLEYKNILQKYLPVVGCCPVYETTPASTLKYYIFFASRHIDAAVLMNDIMFRAYYTHFWDTTIKGTLFNTVDNQNLLLLRDYYNSLEEIILSFLNGNALSRIDLWKKIVSEKFMRYHSSDFKKVISKMRKDNKLSFRDVKGTGRINDQSIFSIKKN